MRHQPSACAMLRRSAACVRPSRRGERDANAEEATGEKQLLRLERPLCKALYVATTYNALSKARPSMTNQENEEVIRCRTCYIALTGGSPTPPHCPLVRPFLDGPFDTQAVDSHLICLTHPMNTSNCLPIIHWIP